MQEIRQMLTCLTCAVSFSPHFVPLSFLNLLLFLGCKKCPSGGCGYFAHILLLAILKAPITITILSPLNNHLNLRILCDTKIPWKGRLHNKRLLWLVQLNNQGIERLYLFLQILHMQWEVG